MVHSCQVTQCEEHHRPTGCHRAVHLPLLVQACLGMVGFGIPRNTTGSALCREVPWNSLIGGYKQSALVHVCMSFAAQQLCLNVCMGSMHFPRGVIATTSTPINIAHMTIKVDCTQFCPWFLTQTCLLRTTGKLQSKPGKSTCQIK